MGIVLVTPEKLVVEKSLRLGFLATNNKAEYKALLVRMEMVLRLGGEILHIYLDSRLVVGQVNREFEAKDQRMQGYLCKLKCAQSSFKYFTLRQIPRGQNSHADSLAMLTTSSGSSLPRIITVNDLTSPSYDGQLLVQVIAYRQAQVGWIL